MPKVLLVGFDGTIVNCDLLDELVLTKNTRHSFPDGILGLAARISSLKGMKVEKTLQNLNALKWLDSGAHELFAWCRINDITTIVNSGNIEPVLNWFQKTLKFDYYTGTKPRIVNGKIEGITATEIGSDHFKLDAVKSILKIKNLNAAEVFAVGNSWADIPCFKFATSSRSFYKSKINDANLNNYASNRIEVLSEIIPFLK